MPSGPPELHEKWKSDEKAMRFLQDRGYTITRGFEWKRPNVYHQPTEEEMEAMDYLVLEWDFGWMCDLAFGPQDRERVYMAVDSERDYQDAQAGNAKRHEDQPPMTPGEFILCMEKCLQDARDAWYKPDGGQACMEFIRKVTGLGVQAMERHGAPRRVMLDVKDYGKSAPLPEGIAFRNPPSDEDGKEYAPDEITLVGPAFVPRED